MPVDQAFLVMIIGMVVVFIGLLVLIVVCLSLSRVMKTKGAQTLPAAVPEAPVVSAPAPVQNDEEIIAVITAVIASLAAAEQTGFRVRHIKRTNAWGKSGREELLSSKQF